ncbi:MAG TPA: isoprenylcysteine carboxylmethyltransferase family protein [Synergistaceae bacterium]|nr:isoprenylcysteine carboxylmethyltransferase family protein [Synergistaceae bacterium]
MDKLQNDFPPPENSPFPPGALRRIALATVGACFFLIVVPLSLSALVGALRQGLGPLAEHVEKGTGWVALLAGAFLLLWALIFQITEGGSFLPFLPPRRLITTGPYRYCRNPLLLGLSCYYGGFGVLGYSFVTGLLATLAALALLSLYIKGVEEPRMERAFGDEYRRYRATTPFLIPQFSRAFEDPPRDF